MSRSHGRLNNIKRLGQFENRLKEALNIVDKGLENTESNNALEMTAPAKPD